MEDDVDAITFQYLVLHFDLEIDIVITGTLVVGFTIHDLAIRFTRS